MPEPAESHRLGAAGGPTTSRRPLVLAVIVLVVAVGAFLASRGDDHKASSTAASTANDTQSTDRDIVAELNGDGDEETEPFTLNDGWEIRWETIGESFQVAIRGDRDFGTVINQSGSGGGATYPVGSGTFRFEITARGPWSIKLVNHSTP